MSVAKSYARALFEAASETHQSNLEIDRIEAELGSLVSMIRESKDLGLVLRDASISAHEKLGVIGEIAKRAEYSAFFTNFLVLVTKKERLRALPEILDAFSVVRIEAEGGVLGRIVSADSIDAEDIASLSSAFSQKLGHKVAFKTVVDPQLLAGMKVTVSGVTYDGTLRSQLQRLRDRLVLNSKSAH